MLKSNFRCVLQIYQKIKLLFYVAHFFLFQYDIKMFKNYKRCVQYSEFIFLEFLQATIQVFEFQNLADEEVTITMRNFRVGDVNHVVVDVEVQLRT